MGSKDSKFRIVYRLLVLLLLICVTLLLIRYREEIASFQNLGLFGIFLISLLTNATLIVPVPGVMVSTAMGAVFNPFLVAIVSGFGAALGELSGYFAGYSGKYFIDKTDWMKRVEKGMTRYGDLTILLLAFVPNPLFDIAGILAGASRIPIGRFLVLCFVGKFFKMLIFSLVGSGLIQMFW